MAKTTVEELVAVYKGDTKGIERATKKANKAVDGFAKQTEKAGKRVSFSFESMAKSYALVFSAVRITNIADEFTLLKSRIDNATRSTEEYKEAFSGIKEIARETGADMGAAVDVFQRISFVRDEINSTTGTMLQFTETVSKLGVVSGASTGALRSGLTQLGQSLSSGIVRAEEFNSIMENIPAVGVAIAEEFGVTTGQLRNLVIEGEILSKDVFQAILNQSEKVREEFDKFPQTIGRAFQNIKIRIFEAVDGINSATNSTGVLISAMEVAGKSISAVAKIIQGWAKVISAFYDLVIARIIDVFNKTMMPIEKAINLILEGIAKIRRETFEPIDITLNVSANDLAREALSSAKKDIKDAGDAFTGAAEDFASIFDKTTESVKEQNTQVVELSKSYSDIAEKLKVNDEAAKASAKAQEKLMNRNNKRAKEYADTLDDIKKKTQENRNEMVDLFSAGIDGWDSFKDAALNALREILINASKTAAGGKADNSLLGTIGSAIGGIFSGAGGFVKSSGTAAYSSHSSAYLTARAAAGAYGPTFATGGSIMEDRTTGGPDNQIVTLRKSPNERLSITRPGQKLNNGGGGGTVIQQNINVTTGVQQTVRAEIARLLPQIQQASISAVQDAKSRSIMRGA